MSEKIMGGVETDFAAESALPAKVGQKLKHFYFKK